MFVEEHGYHSHSKFLYIILRTFSVLWQIGKHLFKFWKIIIILLLFINIREFYLPKYSLCITAFAILLLGPSPLATLTDTLPSKA